MQTYEYALCNIIHLPTDGDILGGMADAVEQAAVVLVCFSQRYKDSQSCRTGNQSFILCCVFVLKRKYNHDAVWTSTQLNIVVMISKIDQVSTMLITIYELHNYDTSRPSAD